MVIVSGNVIHSKVSFKGHIIKNIMGCNQIARRRNKYG